MARFFEREPPIQLSPELAHEMIYGSIEYAERYGFQPHRDFEQAKYVLDPPDAHPRTGQVEFGHNGKPFFVQGPYDNAEAILHKLQQTAGEGSYEYMMPIGGPLLDEDDF